ncbi:ribosome maturation factor RimM, partial [Dysosmobacter welbionis]
QQLVHPAHAGRTACRRHQRGAARALGIPEFFEKCHDPTSLEISPETAECSRTWSANTLSLDLRCLEHGLLHTPLHLFIAAVLCQHQLRQQDLAGRMKHLPLPIGEAPLPFPEHQPLNHTCHLVQIPALHPQQIFPVPLVPVAALLHRQRRDSGNQGFRLRPLDDRADSN